MQVHKFGVAALLAGTVLAGEPQFEVGKPLPCQSMWVFKQAQANLPQTGTTFDFSSNAGDLKLVKQLESGKASALISLIAAEMKRGAAKPTSVTLVGPTDIIEPMLRRLSSELEGQRLPYLTMLFIGPIELQTRMRALVEDHEAVFRFVPYAEQTCEAAPK